MARTGVRLALLLVIPQLALAWGESRHSIDEVLIEHTLVDSSFVYCGCNTDWGSNTFGLFVFDRRNETWANYGVGNGLMSNRIDGLRESGDRIAVEMQGWRAYFDRATGSLEVSKRVARKPWTMADTLRSGDVTYVVNMDTLIIDDGHLRRIFVPPTPPPLSATMATWSRSQSQFPFFHPVAWNGKVVFAYHVGDMEGYIAAGVGVFDLPSTTFSFYPSGIFKGVVTDCFVEGNSIILATAERWYESNAEPASGLIRFAPETATFEPWTELALPPVPLAILSVDEDDREYWIGTDKGVIRADKSSGECRRYSPRTGVAARDGVNVHGSPGGVTGENYSPVFVGIAAGDTVRLRGVYNGWCETDAPPRTYGYIRMAECVEEGFASDGIWSRTMRVSIRQDLRSPISVRAQPYSDSTVLADFYVGFLPTEPFKVAQSGVGRNHDWYSIRLPTAWVYGGLLVFVMEEVGWGF
ncbi:hypothetical protein JXA88_07925 [Candidatus Fermentibacteria bacterium]|nr:hypothetical protein [Candidatus Fermentibacteria bacterium]